MNREQEAINSYCNSEDWVKRRDPSTLALEDNKKDSAHYLANRGP